VCYEKNPGFSDRKWRIVIICRTPWFAKTSRRNASNRELSEVKRDSMRASFGNGGCIGAGFEELAGLKNIEVQEAIF